MRTILPFLFLVISFSHAIAQSKITGTITNKQGEPLPGTTVLVPGTKLGTVSGINGDYSIELPPGHDTLSFQFVGFKTSKVPVNGQSIVDVQLEESLSNLGEIVVVGFGKQSRRNITSSVSSTGEEAFRNVSVPNFQRALQGRMPGVVITNASGGLNAEAVIRIRGTGSIGAGNQPLIVVDGLVLAAVPDGALGVSSNPFIGIEPNNIESVEVLKDAAAAAIYGSRGSNGVILITTKTGNFNQPPKVSLGYYAGFSEISKKQDLLNTEEYVMLWNEAAQNAGYDPASQSEFFYPVGTEPYADWQNLLLRKGFVQEVTASVSGGTLTTKYYFGGTMREEEQYLRTIGLKRYSVLAKFEQKIGNKVTAGISINPSRTIDNKTGNAWPGSAWGASSWFAPNFEALDENGNCRRDILLSSNGQYGGFAGNPCTVLEDQWIQTTTTYVLLNSHLNWTPLPNFRLSTQIGVETDQLDGYYRFGANTWFGASEGAAGANYQNLFNYNWTNLATWRNNWDVGHELEATAGVHLAKESLDANYSWGSGFVDDRLRYLSAAASTGSWSFKTDAAFLGYLARLNYAFQNRYLLTLTARYDGSSRFGNSNRYGFFPALSAGWVISDEDFFKVNGLDFLKIRSSIGVAGNAEIGNFAARGLVSFDPDYVGESGYILQSIENDALGWEKNVQWDAGLEFSLFNNRISGMVEYYIKDTKDLLLERPIPATNGFSFLTSNVGEVRNQGFEFELNADILHRKDFTWNLQLNGATLKNEVRKLVDQDGDGKNDDIIQYGRMLFRPGESVGTYFLVEYAGVNPTTGDALFYNLEGNTVVNDAPGEYRKIFGNSMPAFTGGIANSFRYKNFDLSAFFHFKTGYKIYLEDRNREDSFYGDNLNRSTLDRWTPTNPNTDVPQVRLWQTNGSQHSTRYLEDGDFLRLKNLTLGFTFQGIGKRGSAKLRVFAAAQNLLTFTKFRGLDPDSEFRASAEAATGTVRYNLPASKTYSFGFNLDF